MQHQKIRKQFQVFLVLSIVGLVITGITREVWNFANIAFEGLVVAITGMLLAMGIYLQGYEEAKINCSKVNPKDKE